MLALKGSLEGTAIFGSLFPRLLGESVVYGRCKIKTLQSEPFEPLRFPVSLGFRVEGVGFRIQGHSRG